MYMYIHVYVCICTLYMHFYHLLMTLNYQKYIILRCVSNLIINAQTTSGNPAYISAGFVHVHIISVKIQFG